MNSVVVENQEIEVFVNGFVKFRKAKMSARGVYLQDKELLDTVFQVGTFFKYDLQQERKMVVILPCEQKEKYTVSKRKMKDCIKPVIDIRGNTVLSVFEGCTELQVTIFTDRIEVVGIE
jgi:DNA (cytosine-5)-methyltransferase 1